MACDYIFGKGICCGGTFGYVNQRQLINDACGYLTNAGWTAIDNMPEKLMYHASIPLPDKNWWLISGGQSKSNKKTFKVKYETYKNSLDTAGDRQTKMYYLDDTLTWNEHSAELPTSRSHHCMVQYGPNEVAFIGGSNSTHTRIPEIDIYNLESDTWSQGPELPEDIELTSLMGCAKIENANTIALGCGVVSVNQETNEVIKDGRQLYTLDLSDNQYTLQHSGWSQGFFEKLDDDTLILSGSIKSIYYFDMTNGVKWQKKMMIRHNRGTAFTLPDNTLTCT